MPPDAFFYSLRHEGGHIFVKISVIIPYHDEKRYLNDCLESLEEQTFQDFEWIVIDDGSTDEET